MKNLELGNQSILNYVEDFNESLLKEDETGVCIEIGQDGLDMVLDDGDWSYFMSMNGAKFIGNDSTTYYYEIEDKFLIIPIAEISDDECDIYLDVNNVEVVNTLDVQSLDLV